MKDYVEELGSYLEDYITTYSIPFLREDPRVFASRLYKTFSILFFSCTEDEVPRGLKEKTLYALWNFVIDDIIEYTDKGRDNISESLEILTVLRNEGNYKPKTKSGQIIHDFIQQFYNLPSEPNKRISEELIFLDLIRIMNGFDYERIVHENNLIGNLSEYMEFGAITADVRIILDIDIALYPHELNRSIIRDLREAYKWFGLALKLRADIATFEREYFVEASHNAITLIGQEKGLLPRDILKAERKRKERLFKDVIPVVMNEVEQDARVYLSRSLEHLNEINEIDTSNISAAFKLLFEEYPGHKDFSSLSIK